MRYILPLCLLAACTSEPNHLGNPLLLPLNGLTTAAENAVYRAKRARVKAYLEANAAAVQAGDAGTLLALWDVAGVPVAAQPLVTRDLAELSPGPDWAERATIVVIVRSR